MTDGMGRCLYAIDGIHDGENLYQTLRPVSELGMVGQRNDEKDFVTRRLIGLGTAAIGSVYSIFVLNSHLRRNLCTKYSRLV